MTGIESVQASARSLTLYGCRRFKYLSAGRGAFGTSSLKAGGNNDRNLVELRRAPCPPTQRINPIGAETSLNMLRGFSSYLYDYLLGQGAGYGGDLFYE